MNMQPLSRIAQDVRSRLTQGLRTFWSHFSPARPHSRPDPRDFGKGRYVILAFATACLFYGLLGCVTSLRGATPEQRLFEAKQNYSVVLAAAVAYAESPGANPVVVRTLVEGNQQAQALLSQAELLLRAPESPDRDDALDSTARLLVQITTVIRQYLVEAAGDSEPPASPAPSNPPTAHPGTVESQRHTPAPSSLEPTRGAGLEQIRAAVTLISRQEPSQPREAPCPRPRPFSFSACSTPSS